VIINKYLVIIKMTNSKPIEIKLSKAKLILMFLACVMFVVLGVSFIRNPAEFKSFIMRSPTFIFSAGWASVIFFGGIGFFLIKKLNDKSYGLVISKEGITDNSSGVSAGFIPWTDIIVIRESKVANQKLITIVVKNPEFYINSGKNILEKRARQINYKILGTPIGISANGLKINYKDLKTILEKSFNDFKSQKI
jgi:hypothetical protein